MWSKLVLLAEIGFGIRLTLFGVSFRCIPGVSIILMGIGFLNVECDGVFVKLVGEFVHFVLRIGESRANGVPNSGCLGESLAVETDGWPGARNGLDLATWSGVRER